MWLYPLSDDDQQTFVAQYWRTGDTVFVLAYQIGVTNVEWGSFHGYTDFAAAKDKPFNQAIHLALVCSTIYEIDAHCKTYRNGRLKSIAKNPDSTLEFEEVDLVVSLRGPMAENIDIMRFPWIVGQSRRRCVCICVYVCVFIF